MKKRKWRHLVGEPKKRPFNDQQQVQTLGSESEKASSLRWRVLILPRPCAGSEREPLNVVVFGRHGGHKVPCMDFWKATPDRPLSICACSHHVRYPSSQWKTWESQLCRELPARARRHSYQLPLVTELSRRYGLGFCLEVDTTLRLDYQFAGEFDPMADFYHPCVVLRDESITI
ncbi:hypothetical protein NEOLEDRAFT_289300 [Neolentinus lepideus HHB14362 ss-1]|uniref:Uncharacterized protein n=1 Tax=Neolentinus lepideus HHB14362 ss-1 TaxID=1314782 RepID=A0A165SZJ7_9AGAM|nr:hypothetical protein NEOLEDRAFT_289300 [Neolentinus lepideus HHB14362 ss-1]